MRPDLQTLFGFRLLNFRASTLNPKVGLSETVSPECLQSKGISDNDGAMSRISAKVGGEPAGLPSH